MCCLCICWTRASLAAGAGSDLWGGYLPLQAIPLTLVGDVQSVGLPTLAPMP